MTEEPEWGVFETECDICGAEVISVAPLDIVEPGWECPECGHNGLWPKDAEGEEAL